MLFSVVIPTFNRRQLLERALESVWQQRCTDYEVIVVDDGSTDDTAAYLRSLGERGTVLAQANRGAGAARNLALQHAKAEYVAFLDSDDEWFPWTLETHARAIREHNRPAMCAGVGVNADLVRSVETYPEAPYHSEWHPCFFEAFSGPLLPIGGTPSIVLKRDVLQRVGGFADKRINGEDTDLWLRFGTEPGFVRLHSPPVFRQRVHEGNITENCRLALDGFEHLHHQEESGAYPGGASYRRKRIEVLAADARVTSLRALASCHFADAWKIYRGSFRWQLELGRVKYLCAFPFMLALKRMRHPQAQNSP